MAETDVSASGSDRFRNPGNRFRSTRTSGFAGGTTDSLGNYQNPTSLQISGLNEKPASLRAVSAAPAPDAGGASSLPSINLPKAPGVGSQVAGAVAGKAATEFGKEAITRAGRAMGFGASPDFSAPLNGSDPLVSINAGYGPASTTASRLSDPQFGPRPDSSSLQNMFNPVSDATSNVTSGLDDYEFGVDYSGATDGLAGDVFGAGDAFSSVSDGLAGDAFGSGAGDAFGDAAGGAGGIPFLGAGLQLARGNVGGAIGSVVGNLILPGIGGIIGGILGGGGGKVICTEIVSRGDAPIETLFLELQYGKTLAPAIMRGYHWWAIPYVRLMRRSELVYRITKPFALGWMREAAARASGGRGDWLGKVVLGIGMPACWLIGQFVGESDTGALYGKV